MNKKRDGFYMQLDEKDRAIMCHLKNIHSINISHLIKNLLREYYEKISKTDKTKQ
jgi:hypothetical protein